MQSTQDLLSTGIRFRLAIINHSQGWLADQIGMSKYSFSRRMHGNPSFDVEVVDKIADALGTDFASLIQLPIDNMKPMA